ncbi:class II glutamine amidotransferase [Alloscardovia theropitheci]|uniref:Class II glutamine amidotransferase n=1 Tax=Alloscardovia theropitheci TaxID=2496842 RepID=A0A4R0QPQ8_9BIFI|nr:class II glutamine amidotransferase [Alloscardovia theropitheci]TCD54223.1 class II glutamine amidotransferase [Alloscardovia theropitheci]
MCRLLGYLSTNNDITLRDAIGSQQLDEFKEISRIHNDGWGVDGINTTHREAHVDDGGAPSPEVFENIYRTTEPAFLDHNFESLASTPARSAIFHLRLASSNLPLIPENQQPFTADGISFAHNGDISSQDGVNLVHDDDVLVSDYEVAKTGGKSDSAIFFAHILHFVDKGLDIAQAAENAIATLREQYKDSSYNCLVQTQEKLVCVNATGHDYLSDRVTAVYDKYGQADKAKDYRVIRYKKISGGVVVASSGFDQKIEDGWKELPKNHILIADSATGEYEIRPLA